MRPAVHASILRNRGSAGRSRRRRQHVFSSKRLLLMVFGGVILFVPGLGLSVAGLEYKDEYDTMDEWKRVMFRAIGPSMCAAGALVMFASCIYYYCYGSNEQPTPPSNEHHALSSPDQDEEKGSIRSSSKREHGHHHHHHYHHHHHHHNGKALSPNTPDSECRVSFRGEEGRSANKTPNRTPTKEEEVPLAKMEDSSEIAQGQAIAGPTAQIFVHEPSEDMDFDDNSTGDSYEDDIQQNDVQNQNVHNNCTPDTHFIFRDNSALH